MPTLKIYITVTVAAENEHSVRGNGVRMVSVVVCVAFYASSQRVPSVVSVARVCSVGRSALRSQPERLSLSISFSFSPLLRGKSTCVFHNTETTRDWKKKREREKTTTISEHQWQTGNRSRGGAVVLLRTQQGTIGCSSNSETKRQKSCTVSVGRTTTKQFGISRAICLTSSLGVWQDKLVQRTEKEKRKRRWPGDRERWGR